MGVISVDGVKIAGVSCCVPSNRVPNSHFAGLYSDGDFSKIETHTGIVERRIADVNTCTSDLCYWAAVDLFERTKTEASSIDVVLFVSQTPDYVLPATACILQNRLGLTKATIAFDINLGCSGYVYGLWLASTLVASGQLRRVLLLVGDTCSKFVSDRDKSTAPLFGDAGSATLVEHDPTGLSSYRFDLGTDGAGGGHLIIPSGRFRENENETSHSAYKSLDSAERSSRDLFMNGGEIFNFTIGTVSKSLENFVKQVGPTFDAYVFHQANGLMLRHLQKKLGISDDTMWMSLEKFGNTSSASIPLTIVANGLNKSGVINGRFLLAGFGVGYSWGFGCVDLSGVVVSLTEVL
ncbi:ketoacyl-ACP synthase III [bacterium]|nr:ketoacyl-ACP synthase III [bacterium]